MSSPQRLITSCGEEIVKLVETQKKLKDAIADLRGRMIRLDRFTQRTDEKEWCDIQKESSNVQEKSQHGALKLSAAIEMYVSLQEDVSDDEIDEMILELDGLRTRLAEYELDQHAPVEQIIARIKVLSEQQQRDIHAHSASVHAEMDDAGAQVEEYRKQLAELRIQEEQRTAEILAQSGSGVSSYLPSLPNIFGRSGSKHTTQASAPVGTSAPSASAGPPAVAPAGTAPTVPPKSPSTSSRRPSRKSTLDGQEGRAIEGQIRVVREKLLDAQDRYDRSQSILKILERADAGSLADSVQSVIKLLQKQDKQMKALPELRAQLSHEMDTYKRSFASLRTYPTAERKAALKTTHQHVTASASAWRSVAMLLSEAYAKGGR